MILTGAACKIHNGLKTHLYPLRVSFFDDRPLIVILFKLQQFVDAPVEFQHTVQNQAPVTLGGGGHGASEGAEGAEGGRGGRSEGTSGRKDVKSAK